jgi:hypothetical protein
VNQALTAATPGAPGNPTPDRPTHNPGRPIGTWAFLAVTITSLGDIVVSNRSALR